MSRPFLVFGGTIVLIARPDAGLCPASFLVPRGCRAVGLTNLGSPQGIFADMID